MIVMKISSALMALLFIAWAAFQYNDPDPFVWIVVYGLAALASILFLINRLKIYFPLGFLAIGIVWAIILYTQAEYLDLETATRECELEMGSFLSVCEWIPQKLTSEKWREMGGLIFISAWMGILTLALGRSPGKNK